MSKNIKTIHKQRTKILMKQHNILITEYAHMLTVMTETLLVRLNNMTNSIKK